MRRYLDEFLSDRRVIDYPALEVAAAAAAGDPEPGARSPPAPTTARSGTREADESPLRTITRDADRRGRGPPRRALRRPACVVDFAMRYGNPSTASVIARLRGGGLRAPALLPALPAVFRDRPPPPPTTQAFRALMALRWQPAIRTVPAYYDHPLYIEALAPLGRGGLRRPRPAPRRARHQLPRHARALPAPRATPTTATARRRRGCSATGSASGGRGGRHLPVALRPRGVAEALHRRGGRPPRRGPASATSRSWRRSSRPTASRRWRRSTSEIREAFLARRRRELHLHPLPQRRGGARRHDGGDPRARARRLALSLSLIARRAVAPPGAARSAPAAASDRRDRTPAVHGARRPG